MINDPYSVKIKRYHHGALREALLSAAEGLLAERGVEGFSLREAARRAGVSPMAPAHHFRDVRGLLTALAARAFNDLITRLEKVAAEGSPRPERLTRMAISYVEFAVSQPARFDLMWRTRILDPDDHEYREAADRAFAVLNEAVSGSTTVVDLPTDPSLAPSVAAWSVMHGFARSTLDGAFGADAPAIDHAVKVLLPATLASVSLFCEDGASGAAV
jgi:AcrR family transcriptional regulator